MQSTHHIKNASIIEYIDGHHAGFHFIGYRECKLLFISLAFLPPNLTNMNKITYRQAAIDSSMPGEFKKCN